jgi:hypothetical protein
MQSVSPPKVITINGSGVEIFRTPQLAWSWHLLPDLIHQLLLYPQVFQTALQILQDVFEDSILGRKGDDPA